MSGGYFQYNQYRIEEIASDIDSYLAKIGKPQEWSGEPLVEPVEVVALMREAAWTLRQAAEMAQRVDWYLSGDDGSESMVRRWREEVRGYWCELSDEQKEVAQCT